MGRQTRSQPTHDEETKRWQEIDDAALTNHYQEAILERDMGKDPKDYGYSDEDLKEIEKEIGERDNL